MTVQSDRYLDERVPAGPKRKKDTLQNVLSEDVPFCHPGIELTVGREHAGTCNGGAGHPGEHPGTGEKRKGEHHGP